MQGRESEQLITFVLFNQDVLTSTARRWTATHNVLLVRKSASVSAYRPSIINMDDERLYEVEKQNILYDPGHPFHKVVLKKNKV